LEQSLGRTAFELGLYERGEALMTRALGTFAEIGSTEGQIGTRADLAGLYLFGGDWERAEAEVERALDEGRRELGPDHREVLRALSVRGMIYTEAMQFDEALTLYGELMQQAEAAHGSDSEEYLTAREGRAYALLQLERMDEAEAEYQELIPRARELFGNDSPVTMRFIHSAGLCYVRMERFEEGLAHYLESLEMGRRVQGSDHTETHVSLINLARLYVTLGRFAEAETHVREALDIAERTMPPTSFAMAMSHAVLGDALQGQERYEEAEPFFIHAYGLFTDLMGPQSGGSLIMAQNIVKGRTSRGAAGADLEMWKERGVQVEDPAP
ncbi:MAG: tetratricopeptide repeat protein, partial [Gemmatimonadetes bacterium]|nr:tetratricopeptide repeat protein [Gemmatimonadota bacterium]